MFDEETRALLRVILEEVCEDIDSSQNGIRPHVAAKILVAAGREYATVDNIREAGREALRSAPTTGR